MISTKLWTIFGLDWRANCGRWKHFAGNPALPPTGAGWKREWTANPEFRLREEDGALLVYYRGHGTLAGQVGRDRDRIALARIDAIGPERLAFTDLNGGAPILDVGPEGAFDSVDALDPTVAVFNGRVFLYYSAIGPDDDSIGLAVSTDGTVGESFEKWGQVMVGRAPSAAVWGGRLYLLTQSFLPGENSESYAFYLYVSDDGYSFTQVQLEPILVGTAGNWDSHTVVTGRLVAGMEGWFYLLFGGSSYRSDEPEHFGLARSRDLLHWEKHPGNPIFGAGARGEPDGGAIWFPAICETDDGFHLLYEGSEGPYSWNLSSTICLATAKK